MAMGDKEALNDLDALTQTALGMLLAGVDTSGASFVNILLALNQVCVYVIL